METNYGIFIGLSCVQQYSNHAFTADTFSEHVLDKIYLGYRKKLNGILNNKNYLENENLYNPIHYYALGNFDIISFCQIDDFYFGNFHYHPFSEEIPLDKSTDYQYQVVNCLKPNLSNGLLTFSEINNFNFTAICRIKINPALIFAKGYKIHKTLFEYLNNFLNKYYYQENENEYFISKSFSWHEFTICLFSNSISNILSIITTIRELDFHKLEQAKIKENNLTNHVFIDTHSTLGISTCFFKDSSEKLLKYNNDYSEWEKLEFISKLQIKTGHGPKIIQILNNYFNRTIDSNKINITDGRSDLTIRFNNINVYIEFWKFVNSSYGNESNEDCIIGHIRKIHSNIFLPIDFYSSIKPTNSKHESILMLDTKSTSELFNKYKFSHKFVKELKDSLGSLNISKDLTSSVISAYTSYNDLICDINLFQYFIEIRPILFSLNEILSLLSNKNKGIDTNNYIYTEKDNVKYQYTNVFKVADLISNYMDIWQIAFLNRFQESKRFGYNSDSKVEFNGGVHQIIQSYDALYKLIVHLFQIPNKINDPFTYLPIATYGRQSVGVRSTLIYLHLNYIQLFQPEQFIFTLPKEVFNQQLQRFYFAKNIDNENEILSIKRNIDKIKDLKIEIAKLLHDENNLFHKKILFDFCDPEQIEERIKYIITYANLIKSIYTEENINNFVFWFWLFFLQSSENYNLNGTFRLSVLKKTFFDFSIAIYMVYPKFNLKSIPKLINSASLKYALTKNLPLTNKNIINSQKLLIRYLHKKKILPMLNEIYSDQEETSELIFLDSRIKQAYLNKIREITIKYQNEFRLYFENCKDIVVLRDFEGNNKIVNDGNLLLCDYHGGFVVRDNNLRIKLFNLRLELLEKLFYLGIRYKFVNKYSLNN